MLGMRISSFLSVMSPTLCKVWCWPVFRLLHLYSCLWHVPEQWEQQGGNQGATGDT